MYVSASTSSLLIAVCAMTLSSRPQPSRYTSRTGDGKAFTGAQETPQAPAEQKSERIPPPKPEPKPGKKMGTVGVVTGKISADGKMFVSDKDGKTWTINNPDAVKGHEGHHVTLKAYVSADKGEVDVVSFKTAAEKMDNKQK